MIIFETRRLLVRRYTPADEEHFYLLHGSEQVMRYIRPVKTREECKAFLSKVIEYSEGHKHFGRWAVQEKISKDIIGSFGIIPVEGKEQMQLGYALMPNYWGKGYATELTVAGLEYIFTKTSIDPIYGYAEAMNYSSKKVLIKAGFTTNGRTNEGQKVIEGFVLSKDQYLKGRKQA